MEAQRLKSLNDYLKRAKFISQSLLMITEDSCENCPQVLKELSLLQIEIPFYELNLSRDSEGRQKLNEICPLNKTPSFLYFREENLVKWMEGYENLKVFTSFMNSSIYS